MHSQVQKNGSSEVGGNLNWQRWAKSALLMGSVLVGMARSSQAATFTVDNTNDTGAGSLRQALADANTAAGQDTITFDPAVVGTIGLTSGQLTVTESVTISGPGASVLAISGSNSSRVFLIDPLDNQKQVQITGLSIVNGLGPTNYDGGGIRQQSGTLLLIDARVAGNSTQGAAAYGGGIGTRPGAELFLLNCTVSGNSASRGGGVSTYDDFVAFNSTFDSNTAAGRGGGLFLYGAASTSGLVNCTISNNIAGDDGGGVYADNSGSNGTQIINCTISGNTASASGGGVYANDLTNLYNCTVANNTASFGGGIANDTTPNIISTIVANNSAPTGPDIAFSVDANNSLIGDTTDTVINSGTGNVLDVDPLIGALQNNGGPTLTHALLPGSPAIGAGSNTRAIDFDQRGLGFPREGGGVTDIGAIEFLATAQTFVVDTLIDEDDGNTAAGDLSLREAIRLANSTGISNDTISFAPSLNGTIALSLGELSVSDNVTIAGPGANVLKVDAGGSSRVFATTAATIVGISGLSIVGGNASGDGGGILSRGALTVDSCTVSGNTATGAGGGIYGYNSLTLRNSTVSGNNAGLYGGGAVFNANYSYFTTQPENKVIGCTISGNTSSMGAAGVYFQREATVDNSTIVDNSSATGTAGGVYCGSTLLLRSTIVANNTAANGPDLVVGSVVAQNSLIEDVTGVVFDPGSANNITAQDPILAPLANNGGPTFTHAPLSGSPVISQGSNPGNLTTDQRGTGFPRQLGEAVDIGAVELNPAPTDIALSAATVPENQPAGTVVGTFSTVDNPEDTHTYTLVSGAGSTDNASFVIVGTELRTAAVFDFETKSSYTIRVRSTDPALNSIEESFTITVTDVNPPPVIGSANFSPASPIVGQTVTFTVTASDPEGAPLTIGYNYGDGTSDATGSHAFASAGTFTVVVNVSDGVNSVTMTLTVVVGNAGAPGDRDGDGFDDFIETALLTNPDSSASRPFDLAKPAAAATGLTVKRLAIRVRSNPKANRLLLSGSLPTSANFKPQGQPFIVSVGGVVRSFVLDKQGRSPNAFDRLRFSAARRGRVNFTVQLSRGTFTEVAREGGSVRVIVFFENQRYELLVPAK